MMEIHPHDEPCHRCNATLWEPVGEFVPRRGPQEDVIGCAFCGLRVRVPAVVVAAAEHRRDDADEFRFQFGRFKGMTFSETDAEPNGRKYLEVIRDTNEKLRGRIEAYLSTISS